MLPIDPSKVQIPSDVFREVADEHERIRIEGPNGAAIYLVCEEDVERIEKVEDRYFAEVGRKALEEFKRSGEKGIPVEEIKAKLGRKP